MIYPGFIGGAMPSKAISALETRAINLYLEAVNQSGGGGKSPAVLMRVAGNALFATLPDTPVRGVFRTQGRLFAVGGGKFCEVLQSGQVNAYGDVTQFGPVYMASNGIQVCLSVGGKGYIFDLKTNTFSQINAEGFPDQAGALAVIDTYFIVLAGDTNQFFISGPLDGTSWSGLDFSSDEEPEDAVTLAELHNYLWIFGENTIVIYEDSGDANFPFSRMAGGQIETGCAAPQSVATLDNTLFWLGADERGTAVAYRADGLLPTRISNHGLEERWQSYATVADAISYSEQRKGHAFFVIHFPTADETWAYDAATQAWHQRGSWDATQGKYHAAISRFHTFCFGEHITGDYEEPYLYVNSPDYADDNGAPLRWLRSAPHLAKETKRMFYARLDLDMQMAEALPDGTAGTVVLRYSDDGGQTWSSELYDTTGALGEYLTRVYWTRLGASRNRVFELSGSDPVPYLCLVNAYLELTEGT